MRDSQRKLLFFSWNCASSAQPLAQLLINISFYITDEETFCNKLDEFLLPQTTSEGAVIEPAYSRFKKNLSCEQIERLAPRIVIMQSVLEKQRIYLKFLLDNIDNIDHRNYRDKLRLLQQHLCDPSSAFSAVFQELKTFQETQINVKVNEYLGVELNEFLYLPISRKILSAYWFKQALEIVHPSDEARKILSSIVESLKYVPLDEGMKNVLSSLGH